MSVPSLPLFYMSVNISFPIPSSLSDNILLSILFMIPLFFLFQFVVHTFLSIFEFHSYVHYGQNCSCRAYHNSHMNYLQNYPVGR